MQRFLSFLPRLKIQTRLVVYYLTFALITVAAVIYFAYTQALQSLQATVEDKLNIVAELKRDSLNQWVDEQQRNAVFLSNLPELRSLSGKLLDPESSDQTRALVREELTTLLNILVQRTGDFQDIQIIDRNGQVVVSVIPELVGTSQLEQPFFSQGLSETFMQAFYHPDTLGGTLLTIATPLLDNSQQHVGVLALHFNLNRVDKMIYEEGPLTSGIKSYLVDTHHHLIKNDPLILAQEVTSQSSAIDLALQGQQGSSSYVNHNGEQVIGHYLWMQDQNMALIVEIDQDVALWPARQLAINIGIVGIQISVILMIAVIILAERITAPLRALSETVSNISKGQLDASAPVLSDDEVGALAQAFNAMTEKLRQTLDGLQNELRERKQAEENLLQFRKVMDESNDAIFLIDLESGRYIDFNKSAYKLLGYRRKELASLNVMDVAEHIPSLEVWYERVELISEKGSLIFETNYRRKDRTIIPVEVSARLLDYKEKNIMVAVVRDITKRKRAAGALVASEMKFRMLAEDSPIVVYQCKNDVRFTFLYLNNAIEKLTGYPKQAFLEEGLSFFDLYHPHDLIQVTLPEDEEYLHRPSFHITYRIWHKSGEWRWVDEWGTYVTNKMDGTEYIVGMMNDITERKQAEEALQESEERFRKIFHSSPIAISITTLQEGRLLDANSAYWALTGLVPEKSLGLNAQELKLWNDLQARADFIEDLKRKGSLFYPDDSLPHVNGNLKDVASFYELIQIGNEDCILSLFYDMSVQKQTMQALQQSEARIRALLNAFPDMIMELSLDGVIINMVPPKSLETFRPADQSVGKRIDQIFDEAVVAQTMFAMQRAAESNHINIFEFETNIGGQIHVMEARLTASTSDTVLMLIRDITQRKWIEKERETLINELEVKNEESETLRKSLTSIVGTFEFSEIIERILDQMKRVIPYDTASVWRVEGNYQYIIASVDLPPEVEISKTIFAVDESNSAYPLIMGTLPYILNNNVQAELTDFQEPPHNYVQSWLAIPLKTRGMIIGLIALDGKNKGQFTEHHAELAVTFGNHIAIALDNARLFSELQNELEERRKLIAQLEIKNAESETLRESVAIVAATLEKSEAIDRILEQLERVVPFDSASVQLINGSMLEIVSARGFELSPNKNENCFELNEAEPAHPVIRGDLPYVLYEDIQAAIPAFTEVPHNLIHAWMAVPLKVKGQMIGIIALDGYQIGQFSERHAQLAVAYANQVAIALENARLFSDLQAELSARKKLISELENKNAELERFTYTVSHDLKSPLFTIRGFLGYLEKDAFSGNHERLKSDIQRITDATEKMQRLLNELLELSRVGRLKNESTYFSFEELAREALELVHGRLMEKGIMVQIGASLPMVYGDRPRLAEVLQNLLDNAAKFIDHQQQPCIEIGQNGEEDGKPIFFVRDNGMGISPEHHERVFGLFNKLDPKTDGTGIGLALVKRIIEVHGGRIWIQSEVGKGCTFFFTLPVSRAATS